MADAAPETVDGSGFDACTFCLEVRRFATDACHALRRTDSPADELIVLHARVFALLNAVSVGRSAAMLCWLLAMRQRIGARLWAWSEREMESLVA